MAQSTQISYEVHDTFTGLLSVVNNFIQQEDDEDFIGTWMMIASFEIPENIFVLNKVYYLLKNLIRTHGVYTSASF